MMNIWILKKVGQRLKKGASEHASFAFGHLLIHTQKRKGWKAAGVVQDRNGAENDEEKSVGNDENTANGKKFMFNSRRSMLFLALLFCPDFHVVPCRCFRLW